MWYSGQRRGGTISRSSSRWEQVSEDDLPPAFMKNALVALEGFECDCC